MSASGAQAPVSLPPGLHVIERGWLSANTVVACEEDGVSLVDSGYYTHTGLLEAALHSLVGGRHIDAVYNTHLHSDHCGGNAWLAKRFEGIRISIPANAHQQVKQWAQADGAYAGVGQTCPQFMHTHTHSNGQTVRLAAMDWRVIDSPGHDNDSVMFFNEEHRILMSADALWENGFGALFPLIEGLDAIADQTATLDLIESLNVRIVIPGHGSVFTEVNRALDVARSRIRSFAEKPERTLHNTFRVLVKFNLLEWQRLPWADYREQFARYGAIERLAARVLPPDTDLVKFADGVADALVSAGVARWEAGCLVNV